MPTLLLVRHGRTAANAGGILAGRTPGIGLDETGRSQAAALARRLAVVPVATLVTSPMQRCQETAAELLSVPGPAGPHAIRPTPVLEDRLTECNYGDWTGRPHQELMKEPLWRVVQTHPSGMTFPGEGGESLAGMQARGVAAVREHNLAVAAAHGDDAIWVAVSHGDVISTILAEALGMHLDLYQRIVVDPCSVSVIRYTPLRPFVVRVNDRSGDLSDLVTAASVASGEDAVIGGPSGDAGAAVPDQRETADATAPGAAS